MKKLISFALILVLSLTLLVSCKSEPKRELNYVEFYSDNGYSLSYPDIYTPTTLTSKIDFVIIDDLSGSSLTVMTSKKEKDLSKKGFEKRLRDDGIDTSITYFEEEKINDIPCIVMEYPYAGSKVTEIVYNASDNMYTATFTQLPDTDGDFVSDMEALLRKLEV